MLYYNLQETSSERVAGLLEMIWRRGPELMRCGGGGLGVDSLAQGVPVSARERREIVRLRRLRWGMKAIAEAVGRSQPTVSKVCRAEGLARFRVPRVVRSYKKERARVKALRVRGVRWRVIAAEVGVSRSLAQKLYKEAA